mgnify:CR=1 FL=1
MCFRNSSIQTCWLVRWFGKPLTDREWSGWSIFSFFSFFEYFLYSFCAYQRHHHDWGRKMIAKHANIIYLYSYSMHGNEKKREISNHPSIPLHDLKRSKTMDDEFFLFRDRKKNWNYVWMKMMWTNISRDTIDIYNIQIKLIEIFYYYFFYNYKFII